MPDAPTKVIRLPFDKWREDPEPTELEPLAAVPEGADLEEHVVALHKELERVVRERNELVQRIDLLQGAPDLTIGVGLDRRIFAAEGASESVWGWSAADLVGTSPVDLCHPEDVTGGLARFHEALQNPGKVTTSLGRFKTKAGEYVWISRTVNAIERDGKVVGVRACLRPVGIPTLCTCGESPTGTHCSDGNAEVLLDLINAVQLCAAGLHSPGLAARFNELAQAMRTALTIRTPHDDDGPGAAI